MAENKPLTPTARVVFGLLFVGFGIFPMLASFDIGPLRSSDINGPPWLGLAAGGVFAAGGLAVLAGERLAPVRDLMIFSLLLGLAALGNWVAFGAGERVCAGASLAGIELGGSLRGVACRIPFAVGALAMIGIVVLAGVAMLQTRLGGPPALARSKAAAETFLLVCLAPVLIVLAVAVVVPQLVLAVWTRCTTGAWPRNEGFIRRQRERLLRRNSRAEAGNGKP
jgi:hypothetical protein